MTTTHIPDLDDQFDEPSLDPVETSDPDAGAAQAESSPSEESPTIPLVEVAKNSPISPAPTPETVGRGKWRRRLVRTAAAVTVAAAVGTAAIVGWPVVNDRLLQPVEANSQDTAAVQAELAGALERVTQLETNLDALDARVGVLDTTLDSDSTALSDRIDTVSSRIDTVDTQLDELADSRRDGEAAAGQLGDRLFELKAMELLSRARLFLYQANYGLAAQDVESARSILSDITSEDSSRSLAIERLGVVLLALPDRPVAASADLDIAWQALLGDIPDSVPLDSPDPTPGTPVPTPATADGSGTTTVPGTPTTQP